MENKEALPCHIDKRTILDAALLFVKELGCDHLNMRKLADKIGYSAPMIYHYFKGKDGIYQELARNGYLLLANDLKFASERQQNPGRKVEAMWLAYWDFAANHKEIYQLMFGINTSYDVQEGIFAEAEMLKRLLLDATRDIFKKYIVVEQEVEVKFLTCWALTHGLIILNYTRKSLREEITRGILTKGIIAVIESIN